MFYSKLKLFAVLCATLMMTACASSSKPVTALPMQLPPEYAVRCPAPPLPSDASSDAVMIVLKEMYDLYGVCAGRLVDVVDWIQKAEKEK